MNLSQILNPPGGSSVPEGPAPARRQQRTSPGLGSSVTPSTSILRFDAPFFANNSNTATLSAKDKPPNAHPSSTSDSETVSGTHQSTAGTTAVSSGPSRKHANSVSVSQLHDSTTTSVSVFSTKPNGLLPGQKIRPNETNDGYSTSTFRANVRVNPAKEKSALVITQSALSTNNATAGTALSGAVLGPNPADTAASTAFTAKKKMRQQGESTSGGRSAIAPLFKEKLLIWLKICNYLT